MTAVELSGYVLRFDQEYPMHGGPGADGNEPGWMEKVARDALVHLGDDDKPLAMFTGNASPGDDTPGTPIATTENGTLRFTVDETGVKVEATLNLGFTFRVIDQEWSDGGGSRPADSRYMTHRAINEIRIMELYLSGPQEAAVTP
jgi:hypothetical protein